jgi:hypothetical protein
MRKTLPAALAVLLLSPVAAPAGPGHGGGGSRGGGSHGGSSHGGGSHGGGSHGGGRHGGRGRVIFGGPYWGGWGWWGPDYYGDYYGPGYGPAYGEDQEDFATVDIDVSPEEARAYLDGRYIGAADNFAGDPDYLYLRPGSYRLEFRLEGYESLSINIDAEPGAKIEVHKKLDRTPGAKQYGPREAPRPEDGVQPYWGKRHGAAEPDDGDGRPLRNGRKPNGEEARAEQDQAPPPAAERQKEDAWRQRAPATTSPARQRARLLLSAQPGDAAVYLDDRFLGTAEELGRIDGGVPLTPGRHTITVSRPGFKSRTVEIDVARGEAKKVDVSLDK